MPAEKIEVIAYSGHRGEEKPRSFVLHGETIEVLDILEGWIQEDLAARTQKRFFKVKGSDGLEHTLYYDESTREWFHR